tara:strand:- start:3790 stop:4623 length:834 start_codon:yes stop_codon:yes gene_type:complete
MAKIPRAEDPAIKNSVSAIIEEVLTTYGMSDMLGTVMEWYIEGMGSTELELKVRATTEFKKRFPAIALSQKNGLPPISPDDILGYEKGFKQLAVNAGLLNEFQDNDYIQSHMGAGRSLTEITSRVNDAYMFVANADRFTKNFAREAYGAHTDAALASMFLDPKLSTQPLLDIAESIAVGGSASRFGFNVDKERSLEVVKAGATAQQATKALADLDGTRGLFNESVSERANLTAEREGLDALLGQGSSVEVTRRQQSRKNAFGGSGGITRSNAGLTGL